MIGDDGDLAGLGAAAEALRQAHGFGAVLVKCGEAGFLLVDSAGALNLPLRPADPVDLSGAGDAAVATLAAAMASGTRLRDAAMLANVAAGAVGAIPGNALARPEALLAGLQLT